MNLDYFAQKNPKRKRRECKVPSAGPCASKSNNLQINESPKRKRAYLQETQENQELEVASVISAYSVSTIDPDETRSSEDNFDLAFFSRSWIHLHYSLLRSTYSSQVSQLVTQTGLDQCLIHSLHALITSCSSDPKKQVVPMIILVDQFSQDQEKLHQELDFLKSQFIEQENRVSRAQMLIFDWRVLQCFSRNQGATSLERIESFFICKLI